MAVQKQRYAANIRRYYVYTALFQLLTWLGVAIWVVYLQQRRGLSLTQITLVETVFWLARALGEIPTGVVADTVGRKTSLAIGVGLQSAGMLLYGIAPTFPLFMVANITWGVAATFLSGAQEALLYESLKLDGRENEYIKITGRAAAIGRAMMAVGSVVGGLLGAIDLVLPFIVAAIVGLITLAVVLTFEEPRLPDGVQSDRKNYGEILRQSVRLMKRQPTLRHAILYLMTVPIVAFSLLVIFLQPQAVALGVPVAAIGFFVMMGNGAGMVGSLLAFRADERFGTGRVMVGVPSLLFIGLMVIVFIQTPIVLLVIAAVTLLTELVQPVIMNIIQNTTSDDVRATVLSFQSLLFTLVVAVVLPGLGFIADQWGLAAVYVALAAVLVVSSVALLATRPRGTPAPVLD